MPTKNSSEPRFRDRVILVTGAGDGIGRAVSTALAREGATLVLLGRTLKKLERVYDEIEAAGGAQPAIYPMNLEGASPDDHGELAVRLEAEFGRLDGMLHNAAELGDLRPLQHYDPYTWVRVLQVNLTAPFLLTRSCLDLLRRAPSASVLFSYDTVAELGKAYWGAYGVSKAGLLSLMRILSQELEDNTRIRVNAIDPGPTLTALRLAAFPAEDRERLSAPDDVVPWYLHLLGSDSEGRNGELVRVGDPLPEAG